MSVTLWKYFIVTFFIEIFIMILFYFFYWSLLFIIFFLLYYFCVLNSLILCFYSFLLNINLRNRSIKVWAFYVKIITLNTWSHCIHHLLIQCIIANTSINWILNSLLLLLAYLQFVKLGFFARGLVYLLLKGLLQYIWRLIPEIEDINIIYITMSINSWIWV